MSRMEDIMKAASQSWRIPCRAKAAAMGMVPYIHKGDAMPSRLAGITPSAPGRSRDKEANRAWSLSLAKTEIAEPMAMPSTHQPKICSSWTEK